MSDSFLNISRVIENPTVDPFPIKPNKHVETADLRLFKTRFSIIYRHRRVGGMLIDVISTRELIKFIWCEHITSIWFFF